VGFVNQVSHELRTPLTNIRLYAELLHEGLSEDDGPARQQSAIIVEETHRLSRLIDTILAYARQQRRTLVVRTAADQVDRIVERVLRIFRPAFESKGFTVEQDLQADAVVMVDPDALEIILSNLLGNIEKYAADGCFVRIATHQDADTTRLEVQDHGAGIPASERERIFLPFVRLSARPNDGAAGTGIGLTIARDLARLHGGDISVADTSPGACFVVRLATKRAAARHATNEKGEVR
jgi:signal transduction histidine kinase